MRATSQILLAAATLLLAVAASAQTAPTITVQPVSQSAAPGGTVTFTVSATGAGTGPSSYQWQFNGTNLPNGIITTVAGNGTNGYSGDGGAATNAELDDPHGVAVDVTGNLFIADSRNNRIRKVGTNGTINTVAGNGTNGYSGDGGAATNAELDFPSGVAVDTTGNLFIVDTEAGRIRKLGTNGIIATVAGGGTNYPGDGGAATNAELTDPCGVAVDATGNLFIADYSIRKVGTNGIITTVAGGGSHYPGDGGAATNAELGVPYGVAMDAAGNLFIADTGNNRIRKVGPDGIITTVAGNGTKSYSGDGGAATNAELNYPGGVAVDATGNLFIADYGNNRIREVGTNGIITTVAGNGYVNPITGSGGYSGDGGAATNAELTDPCGVAVDATGNLFIADTGNKRIRNVVFNPSVLSPTLVLNNVGFGNAGAYDVVVSSPYGSVTSSAVNLTIGLILSAPQVTVGSTNFTFLLSGPAGSNYVLQVSTDLSYWSNVSTSTMPVSGTMTLSDAISGYSRRFYRVFMQ
jgi:sugar lactone lactonase YvrE